MVLRFTRSTNMETALILTGQNGHLPVVEVLLRADAQVNQVDTIGWSALRQVSRNGHLSVVVVLMRVGAQVN